jgi:hypothetical protein
VPTPGRRFALGVGALTTALILSGAGAGIAGAEPDDPSKPPNPVSTSETGVVSEPAPTVATPVEPKDPLSALRDLLHKPRSIFGNGRTPGQPPKSTVTTSEPKPDPGTGVEVDGTEVDETEVTVPEAPVKKSPGGSAEVRLPGAAPFSIPLPTVPGTSDRRWTFNLTDPQSAYSSVEDTFANLNSLWAEVYAPFNPFPPPPPKPTLKIMEEEPVIDASGTGASAGNGGFEPTAEGMPDLPVLQAPMAFPAVRMGPPRPLPETLPTGTASQVLGVGTAGVPAGRGAVTQGSVQAGEAAPRSTTSPLGNDIAYRQGFPQYLRTARIGELATVALPGIAGLLALTASGGVIGYRQANSGRQLRLGVERFLQ